MGTERFCGFRELQCEKWGFGEGFGSGLWTSEMGGRRGWEFGYETY